MKHPENLPRPVGYKILVVVPKFEDTDPTAARARALGIEIANNAARVEEAASVVLRVVAIGPEAYKDRSRFPDGPWCKVGDYVLTRAYSGTRFFVENADKSKIEYRFLNDDAIEGVTFDITGISRI
jgi:co-chaperonin GroES (HSP10)